MGFLSYVLLGGMAYAIGLTLRRYKLEPAEKPAAPYTLKHPLILRYLALFFVAMLLVSAVIVRFILGHDGVDILFMIVNSLVTTFVFSFGLCPDHKKLDVPMS